MHLGIFKYTQPLRETIEAKREIDGGSDMVRERIEGRREVDGGGDIVLELFEDVLWGVLGVMCR